MDKLTHQRSEQLQPDAGALRQRGCPRPPFEFEDARRLGHAGRAERVARSDVSEGEAPVREASGLGVAQYTTCSGGDTMAKRFATALTVLMAISGCTVSSARAGTLLFDAIAAKAYIGLVRDNAIAVLDTATNRVIRTIPALPRPHGIVATPDGRKVYVSSETAGTVSVIDTATDRVARTIEVGPMPHGLAVSPDGRLVVVAGFDANQVILIDAARDQVLDKIPVPWPHSSAISPDGRTAYVASQHATFPALVIIDLVRRIQTGTVPLSRAPRALTLGPDGTRLYVTVAGSEAVQVVDPVSHRTVGEISIGASPHSPLFTPDGRSGLVVAQDPGELVIVDPTTNRLRGHVTVGRTPHWIAASSDGQTASVTNEGSDTVSVVDLARRTLTATIPVGHKPRKIVMVTTSSAPVADPAPAIAMRRAATPARWPRGTVGILPMGIP